MKDKMAKIELQLSRYEAAELRGLLGNRGARKIIKEAEDFFSFRTQSLSSDGGRKVVVCLSFANRDSTEFGAVLRKIEQPELLKRIYRSGPEREAIDYLEQIVGMAASQMRSCGCKHYEDCLDYVLLLRSDDDPRTKHRQLAEQEETCLGFACVECLFYQEEISELPFYFKQPTVWEAMLGNFIFETA